MQWINQKEIDRIEILKANEGTQHMATPERFTSAQVYEMHQKYLKE